VTTTNQQRNEPMSQEQILVEPAEEVDQQRLAEQLLTVSEQGVERVGPQRLSNQLTKRFEGAGGTATQLR
jgi:hypothetical protein